MCSELAAGEARRVRTWAFTIQRVRTGPNKKIGSTDETTVDVIAAVQRQHIICFHQGLQTVGDMLLADYESAIRQCARDIRKHRTVVNRIAGSATLERINNQLFRKAGIVIKKVESSGVFFWIVVLQLSQNEVNKVPDGRNEGAYVMKVPPK